MTTSWPSPLVEGRGGSFSAEQESGVLDGRKALRILVVSVAASFVVSILGLIEVVL